MAEVKHAPGPWKVGPVDDTVVTRTGADGRYYEIADITGDYNHPDEWPVMEANARLISAAPDLLEALKALRNECSGTQRVNMLLQLLEQADAAIAKAEGRT